MAMSWDWLTWKLARRIVIVVGLILLAFYLVTFVQVWRAADDDDRTRIGGDHRARRRAVRRPTVTACSRPGSTTRPSSGTRASRPRSSSPAGSCPAIASPRRARARTTCTSSASPTTAILRETTGRTSWESLAASARFLQDRGIRRGRAGVRPVPLAPHPSSSPRSSASTRSRRRRVTSPIGGIDEWLRYVVRGGCGSRSGEIVRLRSPARGRHEVGKLVPGLAILVGPSGVV